MAAPVPINHPPPSYDRYRITIIRGVDIDAATEAVQHQTASLRGIVYAPVSWTDAGSGGMFRLPPCSTSIPLVAEHRRRGDRVAPIAVGGMIPSARPERNNHCVNDILLVHRARARALFFSWTTFRDV